MSESQKHPTNLLEAVRYFSDPNVCIEFVAKLRWPSGPVCPVCGSVEHSYLSTRRVWKCKACKKQFSVKVGTIFEDSAIGLDKWLTAVWLIANSKNGISSHELGRALGITQKSAWFVLHRIRLAMQSGNFDKLDGHIEVDETYIGGLARNMHWADREAEDHAHRRCRQGESGRGLAAGWTCARRRHSGRGMATLHGLVKEHVAEGSAVYTDKFRSYRRLDTLGYDHRVIDHAERYVDGLVHTNGLENFWSLLKRGLHGTYVSVRPFHLFRYLDERSFTYNERGLDDLGRFKKVLRDAVGRRLTYAELTGRA